jgi:hypothetical protein
VLSRPTIKSTNFVVGLLSTSQDCFARWLAQAASGIGAKLLKKLGHNSIVLQFWAGFVGFLDFQDFWLGIAPSGGLALNGRSVLLVQYALYSTIFNKYK